MKKITLALFTVVLIYSCSKVNQSYVNDNKNAELKKTIKAIKIEKANNLEAEGNEIAEVRLKEQQEPKQLEAEGKKIVEAELKQEQHQKQQVKQKDNVEIKPYRRRLGFGSACNQFNHALMYDLGQEVKQDYKEAVRHYKLAADQGHTEAQDLLIAIDQ